MNPSTDRLLEVLEQARAAGSLGPGPLGRHIAHSEGFGAVASETLGRTPRNFADLGAGGGIPGLVLAQYWDEARASLVEIRRRRALALQLAVEDLGMDDRIDVLERRAESVGTDRAYREQFEVVTARSFGPPAVTAEVGSGLVEVGGVLVVSEQPTPDPSRWPAEHLAQLGFTTAHPVEVGEAHFVVLRKEQAVPDRFPRTTATLSKRPLW